MKNRIVFILATMMICTNFSYAGDYRAIDIDNNSTKCTGLSAYDAASKLKWELTAVAGGAIYLGLKNWNWGSSNSFKFHNEGWFGMDTASGGADKLGHMYSSYLINEFLTKSLMKKTEYKKDAAKWAAIYSSSIMFLVEVFDGYSDDHGFSYEDLIFNSMGIGISYLENTVPGLDEKIDLRVEYIPSNPPHNKHPVTDYSGYKYIAALRLSGFESLEETPMKYFELQLGYHTEGFKPDEYKYYNEKRAEFYFAVSVNLSELLFKPAKRYTDSPLIDYIDTFTRYYQVPGTYLPITIEERTKAF